MNVPIKWNAELYHKNSQFQEKYALEILGGIQFDQDASVLDIGCGDGKITAHIAKHHVPQGQVIGVDASQEMITFAQKTFQHDGFSNLSFQVCDVRELPYQNQVDHVVSFWCLHWIPEHDKALRNIKNGLKPGGTATLTLTANVSFFAEMLETINRLISSQRWIKYFENKQIQISWPQKLAEFEQKVKNVGFSSFTVQEVKKNFREKSKEAFLHARKATLPHARIMPDKEGYEFVSEVFENYLNRMKMNSDGSFDVDIIFLLVHATK